jgi:hypothetical protein
MMYQGLLDTDSETMHELWSTKMIDEYDQYFLDEDDE